MEESNQAQQHLKLLSIFHYIVGGMTAFFSSFFIIHLVMGILFLTAPESFAGKSGEMPPPFFGWMFVVMGGGAVLFGWTVATCMIFAGRFIARRQKHLFCLIVAGLSCLMMPFGTILGVFTLVVLLKAEVKEMFGVAGNRQ